LHELGGFSAVAVWGTATDRVFAAGSGLAQFDGNSWSLVAGAPTFPVAALHGAEEIVVGAGSQGRVARWEGEQWITDDLGTTKTLSTVWTDGPDNIYVGERGRELVAHFDGSSWTPLLSVADLSGGVLAVWGGADATDVLVAMSDEGIYSLQGDTTWVALREPGSVGTFAVRPLSPGVALLAGNDGGVSLLADGEVHAPIHPPGPIPNRLWGWDRAGFLVASSTGGIWSYAPRITPE